MGEWGVETETLGMPFTHSEASRGFPLLPSSPIPHPSSLIPQVELDVWHFYLITTVLPNPPAIHAAWIGSVVRNPRRTGPSTGGEHGVQQVGW
jgi:hypothetical protein